MSTQTKRKKKNIMYVNNSHDIVSVQHVFLRSTGLDGN